MFCCLGSKKRNYSPENGAVSDSPNHSVGDKSLRNGSVSISAPIPFVDEDVNTEDHVYVNSSIDELTQLCAKQVRDNNNYQVNTACTDSEKTDTHLAHGGASETGTEESVTEELREAQQQVVLALAEADTMSQDLLMNAVSRLENVATRLESLARSQPASRTSSSSAGDSEVAPFILAFDAILSGPFAQYVSLSSSIGGDVKTQSDMVQGAFQAERQLLLTASQFKQPNQSLLPDLMKPISEKVTAVTDFREKNRNSPFFNHLSTISECIPALGWVTVSPKPGPYVKELADSGMFYGNRVLKEFKEKDPQHVEWIRSWNKTLAELQAYIKQFHTTGTAWNPQGPSLDVRSINQAAPARGGAPPPPPPGPPPPPPPAAVDSSGGGAEQERAALFSQLNKGTDITKGLKKVSDDMKTHKNPALRQGPAPFKAAGPPKTAPKPEAKVAPAAVSRPPLTQLQDKKWIVEYHNNNKDIIIDQTETKQVVYVYKCVGSTITVKGKVNSILLDGCKKSAVVFEDVVSSVEFINCQSVQGQVTGKMPTVIIDKTDGCMMYLSKDSVHAEIVTAKSSELNILVPQADGEYKEFALPEQFKSTWNGSKFVTIATESV